jgi:hypothetical protein
MVGQTRVENVFVTAREPSAQNESGLRASMQQKVKSSQ